jgi:Zn-finger nucleic acid-binding protein
MRCPRHYAAKLERRSLKGIGIDQCPQCTGLWLEPDELKRVLGAMEQAPSSPIGPPACAEDEAPMRCPACGAVAVLVAMPPVRINMCSACQGLWLDAHELGTLKALDAAGELDRLWSRL